MNSKSLTHRWLLWSTYIAKDNSHHEAKVTAWSNTHTVEWSLELGSVSSQREFKVVTQVGFNVIFLVYYLK